MIWQQQMRRFQADDGAEKTIISSTFALEKMVRLSRESNFCSAFKKLAKNPKLLKEMKMREGSRFF
jgi:hypothetical protein